MSQPHASSRSTFRPLPLVAALSAAFALSVQAQSFTVEPGTPDTVGKNLTSGTTGLVKAGAVLSVGGSTRGVRLRTGTISLTNAGTLEQTGTGRAIDVDDSAAASVYILNEGLVTAVGSQVIRLNNAAASVVLDNQGTIWQTGVSVAGERAIKADLAYTSTGNKIVNGSETNRTAAIRSNGNDAVRLGSNFTLVNYGRIFSTSTVNTSCPDYQADSVGCGADISAADGIAIENQRSSVVILNHGEITGPRHGIDGGDPLAATADANLIGAAKLTLTGVDASGAVFDRTANGVTTSGVRIANPVIVNYADGVITGNNGSGVGIDGHAVVINYGTITGNYAGAGNIFDHPSNSSNGAGAGLTTANGDGDGVDIDGIAYIENWGRIAGTGAGGLDSGGHPNGADGIAAGGGTIINHAGATIFGQSKGILIDDGANGTATASGRGGAAVTGGTVAIYNDGSITGERGTAVGLVGDFADTLYNGATGVITGGTQSWQVDVEGSTTPAAAVQMGAGNDTLTNYGRIEGRNGLAIDMGAGDDTLRLLGGTVVGTIDGGAGIDTLETAGTQRFAAGTLRGFENFLVTSGLTTFDDALGAVNAVTVQAGAALRINGGFSTAGALTVNGQLLAPGGDTLRTVNVGTYAQGAAGVLETRLGANGASDRIVASGTATLAAGAAIRPVPTNYVPQGASYTLVSAGTLGADASQLQVANDSALVRYTLAAVGNELRLTATRDSLASVAPAGLGGLGAALDALGQGGNTALGPLLGQIDAQGSTAGAADALRELAPDTSRAGQQAAQMTASAVFSALGDRMDMARGSTLAQGPATGLSAGDGTPGRGWVQALGAWGQQKARSGSNGFDTDAWGLAAGLESDRGATEVMGLSFGLNHARADGLGAGAGDDVRVRAASLGGYFSRNLPDMTLDASLLAGRHRYDSRRVVNAGGLTQSLTGSYDGWQIAGHVEVGFPFAVRDGLTGRWLAGARASYTDTDGYTEQGGSAALNVASTHASSLQSILGAELNWATAARSAVQLRARWLHEFGDAGDVNASFVAGGPAFTSAGASLARDALQLGVGLRHEAARGVTLSLRYDAELRQRYVGHQLMARAMWSF